MTDTQKACIPLAGITLFTAVLALTLSGANGFRHNIDPILLRIGSFMEIRYYGLVYFLAFLTLYLVLARKRSTGEIPFRSDEVEMLMMLGIVLMIAGARLFEAFFYDTARYLKDPLEIFKVWKGGLSFHGALAGVTLAAWLFSRKRRIQFLALTDAVVLPVSIFLALGRFTNFINGELYGSSTTLPWGVQFPGTTDFRHPTQIYESLKNLFIFGILFRVRAGRCRTGTPSFLFLILYGSLRFAVEFLKNYEEYAGKGPGIPAPLMAQILCLIMVAAGAYGLLRNRKQPLPAGDGA